MAEHLQNKATTVILVLSVISAIIIQAGCSSSRYRKQADREVYGIVEQKGREVPGMHDGFQIEHKTLDIHAELPVAPPELLFSEKDGDTDEETLLLDLERALLIAASNSREYQRRKEAVFFQALTLTGERNRLRPHFFWNMQGEGGYDSDEKWTAGARSHPGAEWLMATGTRLSMGLSTTAIRFLSGDIRTAVRSVFDLTLTQPLLRNNRIAIIEPLTQAERDMIYELRDFVRFQRRFTVSVLADYYRVLERRRRLENQRVNYENLVRVRLRAEALGEAGRLPELQVDRARQDELSALDNLEDAEQIYRRILDNFKLKLAIRPEQALILNPAELDELHDLDMGTPPITRQASITIALSNRLDLVTAFERMEDAERKVRVAENALKAGLDLTLGSTAGTQENKPLDFAGGSRNSFMRLDADLPLERTSERNTYRRSLIEYEQNLRAHNEQRDNVVLEVTNRWRDLERAAGSHEIQKHSVRLAEQRTASAEMLFDAGRATTRDVLDSYEALLAAQNKLAGTLVDLRIAMLELERDMDILVIDENGRLQEGAGYEL